MSALGIVGLALNLCACNFVSQKICAVGDPEFVTFYIKNILLNNGIRAWIAAQDQSHENVIFAEEALSRGNTLQWNFSGRDQEPTGFAWWAGNAKLINLFRFIVMHIIL